MTALENRRSLLLTTPDGATAETSPKREEAEQAALTFAGLIGKDAWQDHVKVIMLGYTPSNKSWVILTIGSGVWWENPAFFLNELVENEMNVYADPSLDSTLPLGFQVVDLDFLKLDPEYNDLTPEDIFKKALPVGSIHVLSITRAPDTPSSNT